MMKSFLFILLLALISVCYWTQSYGQQFSIMTYNIHHGADASDQPTLDSMGYFIRRARVDIVALQEVDSMCSRSMKRDQPARLGELAGMEHYFTRHFPYQGGAYGQGLLSQYPAEAIHNFRLPTFPAEEGRDVSVLIADIPVGKNKIFTLAVLHLDYRSAESRMQQVEILLDSLSHIRNLVLAGDFNARPGSPVMTKLLESFTIYNAPTDDFSFPASKPDRRIDFVMVRKDSDLRIVDEYIPSVPFSDHLPVITTLYFD